MIILCDIDGTVADSTHRLKHIEKSSKDWESFFDYDQMWQDKPIYAILETILPFVLKSRVWFVTGRPERTRIVTSRWLSHHLGVVNNGPVMLPEAISKRILMRSDTDRRSSAKVKQSFLEGPLNPYLDFIKLVFEDRKKDAEMFRTYGFTVAHLSEGDF